MPPKELELLSIAVGVEMAAFKPMPTNSINLRGGTLEVSGFVFIFA